jgi:hypothetical protein
MSNIVLFKPIISTTSSSAYRIYVELFENNIIDNPIIFCDLCEVIIDNNMCVFNAYFLRQHFLDYYILIDYEDTNFLNNFQNRKCIVIYNEDLHDISSLKDNYIPLKITSDHIKNIKDILNEKI